MMCWRSTSALLTSDTSTSSASALSAMSVMTIDNNDGWILYSSGWTTSGCSRMDGADEAAASLHCIVRSSMDRPALAVFTFNGTAVQVSGWQNSTSPRMSRTLFSVDDGNPSSPSSTEPYIYQATSLSPGRHTLFIQAHEGFALDHIEYAPSATDSSAPSSSSDCAVAAGAIESGSNSDAAARIVGGILGAAIIVLCAIIAFLLCLRRKERREARRASLSAVPFARHPQLRRTLSEKLYAFDGSQSCVPKSPTPSSSSDLSKNLPASDPSKYLPSVPYAPPPKDYTTPILGYAPRYTTPAPNDTRPMRVPKRARQGSTAASPTPARQTSMPGHIRRSSSEKRLPRKPAPAVHDDYGLVQSNRFTSTHADDGGVPKGREQSLFGLARSDTPFSDTDTELPKYSLPSPTQGYGWTSEKAKEKM
ncbi:uncharacterized protein SCHCODRAFT_02668284 [Schizophyllum commune H4-8]|uniref:Expressed protein n=1 Tax=Schizophyllum commune (strain H4-8 / FGSC 9210) TaxID=578458 RepID=D8Q3T8_SCHCM|nr:uncharacterized protein SCHCODRAFT_02668284 [Schizophyllum commune H4-8]KAI5892892.1 hypothetical protein SCHCODRAFT_02668284 [Schizophyllum commune H4-8]